MNNYQNTFKIWKRRLRKNTSLLFDSISLCVPHPYKKYSRPPEQHVFQKIKHVFASPCPVDTSSNEEI